jgi:hypothetical protein
MALRAEALPHVLSAPEAVCLCCENHVRVVFLLQESYADMSLRPWDAYDPVSEAFVRNGLEVIMRYAWAAQPITTNSVSFSTQTDLK